MKKVAGKFALRPTFPDALGRIGSLGRIGWIQYAAPACVWEFQLGDGAFMPISDELAEKFLPLVGSDLRAQPAPQLADGGGEVAPMPLGGKRKTDLHPYLGHMETVDHGALLLTLTATIEGLAALLVRKGIISADEFTAALQEAVDMRRDDEMEACK